MSLNKNIMECICGGTAKEFTTDFKGFDVRGWKCKKCGEEFLDPRDIQPILKINKLAKEHKLTSKLGVVGNSFALRIPIAIVNAYKMHKGERLEIIPEPKGIKIIPA